MAKGRITDTVNEMLGEFLLENDLEIYDIKYQKEGKDWFLRVFIDKSDYDSYVSTDDCERVSRFLSDKLDEADLISTNYYLEVSSPGMDRALIRDKDFVRYKGKVVDVKLYKAVNGLKQYQGELQGREDGKVIIKDEKDEMLMFDIDQVSVVKLAIIF